MEDIDIIIPAYNCKEFLHRLLYSIATQKKFNNFKVFIVNDCSAYDYSDYVNTFKKYFWVTELKLPKNMGPGYARQYGIDNSNGKYIMFIDSDDFLYSPYSLYMLYKSTKNEPELVISNFLLETEKLPMVKKQNYTWLHGKLYKRSFLEKNNIRFNQTRSNEDNGFNYLVRFHNPNTIFLDQITYIYYYNKNSITRRNNALFNFTGLKDLAYNMHWAINIAINKGIISDDVILTILRTIVSMYFYYLEYYKIYDISKILIWTKDLKKLFNKYTFTKQTIQEELDLRNADYIAEGKKIDFKITFQEFLNKIEEVTND